MHLPSRLLALTFAAAWGLAALPTPAAAQGAGPELPTIVIAGEPADAVPDAPRPQFAPALAEPASEASASGDAQAQQTPAPGSSPAQNPQAQTPPAQAPPPDAQSQRDKASQQVKEEEQQRVLGVVPNFNTTYRSDTVSLSPSQKLQLAFRSSVDPVTFAVAFLVAGYHEALDDDPGFRWGIEGYGRRTGAAYLDAFDGTMLGNGLLPIVFRQDPRYFRLGHGTATHRVLYAMATSFICKHDNTGKWEPNYSNVLGNIAAGAISNLYYPDQNTGIGLTISNGMIVTAEGMAGGVFAEFWPDLSRKFLHRDPTHGLDAQVRAQDAEEKAARKAARQKQQNQPQSDPQ